MHAYIHSPRVFLSLYFYLDTSILTYIHTYIHTYLPTYIQYIFTPFADVQHYPALSPTCAISATGAPGRTSPATRRKEQELLEQKVLDTACGGFMVM